MTESNVKKGLYRKVMHETEEWLLTQHTPARRVVEKGMILLD